MENKKLIAVFSVAEMLLLLVASIFSSKIADLLEINHTVLWVSTSVIVIILAVITAYKNQPQTLIRLPSRLDSRITKNLVRKILFGILYIPASLLISTGAFQLAKTINNDWLGTLSGIGVSGTIILAPLLFENIKEENLPTWPFTIAYFLSVVYSGVGYYLFFYPEIFPKIILVCVMISATTLVGLKYVYAYYTIIVSFGNWYKKLPDN